MDFRRRCAINILLPYLMVSLIALGFSVRFVNAATDPMDPLNHDGVPSSPDRAHTPKLEAKVKRIVEFRRKRTQEREAARAIRKKRLLEDEKRRLATSAGTADRYRIDPALKKAWQEYKDWDHRDREQVVRLFAEYIEKNPDSVFLAEIYYRIGSMYSNNRNHKLGETLDVNLMNRYFKKAEELYDGYYTPQSNAAKSFILGRSLEARMDYYEDLVDLYENGGPEDICPIRSIALCVEGYHPELNPKERADIFLRVKKGGLAAMIADLEKYMFQRASGIELMILANSYPGTELERQARHRWKEIEDKVLDNGGKNVLEKAEMFESVSTKATVSELDDRTRDLGGDGASASAFKEDNRSDALGGAVDAGQKSVYLIYSLGGLAFIAVAILAFGVIRGRGRRPE